MRGFVPLDPESNVSADRFAVIYVPGRNRNRFSANCVQIKQSSEQALLESDPGNKYFAARLIGPSKSSEGQTLY